MDVRVRRGYHYHPPCRLLHQATSALACDKAPRTKVVDMRPPLLRWAPSSSSGALEWCWCPSTTHASHGMALGTSWDGCFMFGSVPPLPRCICHALVRVPRALVQPHESRRTVVHSHCGRAWWCYWLWSRVYFCFQSASHTGRSQTVERQAGEAGTTTRTTPPSSPNPRNSQQATARGTMWTVRTLNGPAQTTPSSPNPRHRRHGLPHGLPRQKQKKKNKAQPHILGCPLGLRILRSIWFYNILYLACYHYWLSHNKCAQWHGHLTGHVSLSRKKLEFSSYLKEKIKCYWIKMEEKKRAKDLWY